MPIDVAHQVSELAVPAKPVAKYSTLNEDPIYGKVLRVGGGVSAPVLLSEVMPKYSKEARKKKIQGNVLLNLIVDREGHPKRIRVIKSLGYGLDENAVEAVRQYVLKPAMENGEPVAVEINIDVNFRIR